MPGPGPVCRFTAPGFTRETVTVTPEELLAFVNAQRERQAGGMPRTPHRELVTVEIKSGIRDWPAESAYEATGQGRPPGELPGFTFSILAGAS